MTTETPTYIVKPAAERGARMPVIGPYPTREAAVAAATPNDYVISTEADVIFTGALLVEVYCAVTGLYVKKFETLDAGRRRLVTQLARYATPPDPETPSRAVNPETGKREG